MLSIILIIWIIVGYFIFSKVVDLSSKKGKIVLGVFWVILLICFCVFLGGPFMMEG